MPFRTLRALSFDCYGTLVQSQPALTESLRGLLPVDLPERPDDETLLARWYACVTAAWKNHAFRSGGDVLAAAARALLEDLGLGADGADLEAPARALRRATAFADVAGALKRFRRYRIVVIADTDEVLLRGTLIRIGLPVEQVISPERARACKPDTQVFSFLRQTLGLPADQIMHVAAHLGRDVHPAREAGLRTAWVNRTGRPAGEESGADLEVPGLLGLCELLGV